MLVARAGSCKIFRIANRKTLIRLLLQKQSGLDLCCLFRLFWQATSVRNFIMFTIAIHTVSHFSYAPLFKGPHFFTKMLESNILYDNLLIDILSV